MEISTQIIRITVIVTAITSLLFSNSNAQIQTNENPAQLYLQRADIDIPLISMTAINNDSLREIYGNTKSNIFAHLFKTDIDVKNKAVKIQKEQRVYYYLSIVSKSAFSLNFTFHDFHIPKGGKLFFIGKNGNSVGAFTHLNNKTSGIFPIAPIEGDSIIIEYSELIHTTNSNLVITRIGHDFKGDLFNTLKSESGSCNVDINCSEGDEWQKEKRAVCKMIIDNIERCTGTLVNNTSLDKSPYLLTANHCIDNEELAENTVFYFNLEAPECGGTATDGYQTLSGATLLATPLSDSLDFALIKLSQMPPKEYNPYLAGWDASGKSGNYNVSIHHPKGDVKKISIEEDKVITGDYGTLFNKYTHWLIQRWEVGTTEGGSSGGPLFNAEKRIIGTLTGGDASCSNSVNDYFQKLSVSYDSYPNDNENLKHWLNPLGSNLLFLDGLDPYIYEGNPISNLQYDDTLTTYYFDRKYDGVWTGKNNVSTTALAEKFEGVTNHLIYGLKFYANINFTDVSDIKIKVWSLGKTPSKELYSYTLKETDFYDNKYFAIYFDSPISTNGSYFIGLEFSPMQSANELISVLTAKHRNCTNNTSWAKMKDKWLPISKAGFNTDLSFEVYVGNEKNPVPLKEFTGSLQNKCYIDNNYYDKWSIELFESDTVQSYNEKNTIVTAKMEDGKSWISSNDFYNSVGIENVSNDFKYISAVKIGVVENSSNDSILFKSESINNDTVLSTKTISAKDLKPLFFNWYKFDEPLELSDTFLLSITLPSQQNKDKFSIGIYDSDPRAKSYAKINEEWVPIENFGFDSQLAIGFELCYSKYFLGMNYDLKDYSIPSYSEKIFNEGITIDKNLVTDVLTINFGNNIISNIETKIVSPTGAVVKKENYSTIQGRSLNIDVSSLKDGLFLLTLTFKDEVRSFKFAKQE